MTFRLPDDAKRGWLEEGVSVNWTLHLFKNDVLDGLTLSEINDLEVADFTEADFAGYSSVTLTSGGWTFTAGDPATGVHSEQTFTRSSTGTAQSIYGYYYRRSTGGEIRGFRQWSAPIVVEFVNDAISITPTVFMANTKGDLMPIGTSMDFRGSTAPDGWLFEDGSAVSRTTYANLFSVIGTTYGSGDGSTTFNLPDSRGRFRLGKAASGTGAVLGETGGSLDHTHDLNGTNAHAKIYQSSSSTKHSRLTGLPSYNTNIEYTASGGAATTLSATQGTELGGASDTANPAYLAANSIIKY